MFGHKHINQNEKIAVFRPVPREPALTGFWMIPGQRAFFFLKHDIQNCCLVTLTSPERALVAGRTCCLLLRLLFVVVGR